MIGHLRGRLLHKQPPTVVLDVGGVGYELEAPMTTFYDLPGLGEDATLHTHMVVRDDGHYLYGFSRVTERKLFRELLRVSGVGPRVGLAILSGLNTDAFLACLVDEDIERLTCVPGVGRKTAQRLIVELRDRLMSDPQAVAAGAGGSATLGQRDPVAEAVSALIALGYKPQQASRAVHGVESASGLSSEEIIRRALQGAAGVGS